MVIKLILVAIPTTGLAVREEFLQRLATLSEFTLKNEPGVLKYAFSVPRDRTDEKSVYAMEEYADEQSLAKHMQLARPRELRGWMESGTVLEGAPSMNELELVEGLEFCRAEIVDYNDPYLVVSEISYRSNGVTQSMQYWNSVLLTAQETKPGLLMFSIYKASTDRNKLFVLAAYADETRDMHDEILHTGAYLSTGVRHVFLEKKAGYVFKKSGVPQLSHHLAE